MTKDKNIFICTKMQLLNISLNAVDTSYNNYFDTGIFIIISRIPLYKVRYQYGVMTLY